MFWCQWTTLYLPTSTVKETPGLGLYGKKPFSCSCSGAKHFHKSSTHSRAVEHVADMLSREGQVLPTKWSLNQRMVEALFLERCYQIQQKCVVFVSPVPDHQACSTDALSMEWDYLRGYAFPLNQSWPRFYRRFGHPGAESF